MSSDLEKYIQESLKISCGPPACYQLQPKGVNLDNEEDTNSKLRRFTFGEQNPRYPNRSLLLVGATGSGKSTLINVLVNFAMGVKFEDKIWFEIVKGDQTKRLSDSQTSSVSVYEIFGFEGCTLPYSLTIIDTPGFGDTKGIEYDDVIPKKLQDLFSVPNGVDSIDAVGLVLKASDNRLDERMAYILNSVTSLFGKDMEQNIVVMITHSEGRKPNKTLHFLDDAKIKCAQDMNNKPVYFCFNNSQKETIEDDSDDEDAQRAFKASDKGMVKFTQFLGNTKPKSLKSSLEVMRERTRLTACIQNARERMATIELKQELIRKNKAELEKLGKLTEENQNIMITTQKTIKVKEEIDSWWDNKAVTCNTCKENCHYPGCTWAWSPEWCAVIKNGRCTSCTGNCAVNEHVKENKKYVNIIETNTTPAVGLMNLEKEMSGLQQQKNECLDEAFQHIQQLEKIALNVDSVSTYIHLEFLIEKMKERGDTEKILELEKVRGRMDEKNQAAGHYLMRSLKTGLKIVGISK